MLLMSEILHHLRAIKPCKYKLPASTAVGCLPSTVLGGSSQDRHKWLGSPTFVSRKIRSFGRGITLVGGLAIAMVINNVLILG